MRLVPFQTVGCPSRGWSMLRRRPHGVIDRSGLIRPLPAGAAGSHFGRRRRDAPERGLGRSADLVHAWSGVDDRQHPWEPRRRDDARRLGPVSADSAVPETRGEQPEAGDNPGGAPNAIDELPPLWAAQSAALDDQGRARSVPAAVFPGAVPLPWLPGALLPVSNGRLDRPVACQPERSEGRQGGGHDERRRGSGRQRSGTHLRRSRVRLRSPAEAALRLFMKG